MVICNMHMGFLAPRLWGLNHYFKWTKLWTTHHTTVCRSPNMYNSATSEEPETTLPNSKVALIGCLYNSQSKLFYDKTRKMGKNYTWVWKFSQGEKSRTKISLQHFIMYTPLLCNDLCREAVHFHCIVYIFWDMHIPLTQWDPIYLINLIYLIMKRVIK